MLIVGRLSQAVEEQLVIEPLTSTILPSGHLPAMLRQPLGKLYSALVVAGKGKFDIDAISHCR